MKIGDKVWLLNKNSFEIFSDVLDERDSLVKLCNCKDILVCRSEEKANDLLIELIDDKIKYHKNEIERLELIRNG